MFLCRFVFHSFTRPHSILLLLLLNVSSEKLLGWWKHVDNQRKVSGNECPNSSLFGLHLNAGNDFSDVTSSGRLFQAWAAATGNARSPIVECFVTGTTRLAVDAERNRLRDSTSDVHWSSLARYLGAWPWWQRKTSNDSCRSFGSGVLWLNLRA